MANKDIKNKKNPKQVTDVSVIPYIRESDILVSGHNVRPDRQHWIYFDDKEISPITARANKIVLDAKKDYKILHDEVNLVGGKAKVIVSEVVDSNTVLYVGEVVSPKTNVAVGNTVIGTKSSATANVVSYEHATGILRGATTTTLSFGWDASKTDNVYVSNVVTVVTGAATGLSSNIISYNGSTRLATVSPALPTAPKTNDIYSIGDSRKLYASNTKQALYSTQRGNFAATIHLPDPSSNSTYAFRTGERLIRILDNPQNQLATSDGDKAYTSRAEYKYTANGLEIDQTQVVNRTVNRNDNRDNVKLTLKTTILDPIAQSFFIDNEVYPEGIFIDSIDLFFKNKGSNLPITVQIRPMVEGYPSANEILPDAIVTLDPADVNTTDAPDPSDSATYTRFQFPAPVYLPPNQDYCFVILTNDYGYDLWVSEVGQYDITNQQWISKQPYLGSMFKSQNGKTFTARQEEDVMFVANKCVFETSGSITFSEYKSANTRVPFGMDANTYTGNVAIDFFHVHSDFDEIPGTTLSYSYRATSNANNTVDGVYTQFEPESDVVLPNRKVVFGPEYATPSFNVQMQFSTTNPDISPIIETDRQNLVTIRNLINNMEITDDIISISNPGTGYSNGDAITFSTSSTGQQATGTVVVNGSGNVISVVITSGGGGYFDNVTATVGGSGSGATLNVAHELDKSGGPALARYIGKTVKLLEGFDSGDLRVYCSAVKPQQANVQIYYKVRNSNDPESIKDKSWVRMQQKGNEFTFSNNGEIIEYEFRPSLTSNTITYTTQNATYTTFNEFKIKAVLASSGTMLNQVPLLYDIRAIAMPADVY